MLHTATALQLFVTTRSLPPLNSPAHLALFVWALSHPHLDSCTLIYSPPPPVPLSLHSHAIFLRWVGPFPISLMHPRLVAFPPLLLAWDRNPWDANWRSYGAARKDIFYGLLDLRDIWAAKS